MELIRKSDKLAKEFLDNCVEEYEIIIATKYKRSDREEYSGTFSLQLHLLSPLKALCGMLKLKLYVTGQFVLFSCRYGIAHPFHAVKQDVNEVNSW